MGPGGDLEDWICTRNLLKTLATKMIYTGKEPFFHIAPVFHAYAILQGICSEVNSVIIHGICRWRVTALLKNTTWKGENASDLPVDMVTAMGELNGWYKREMDAIYSHDFHQTESTFMGDLLTPHNHPQGVDWRYEMWVLQRCGLDLISLLELLQTGALNFQTTLLNK